MTSSSKPFSKCKESDVAEWLEENDDLEKYSDEFLRQNITGETLIDSYQAGTLPDDLKEVGLRALEDRNRVIRFVKQSIEQENLAPVTVEPEIQIQTKQDTQKTITGFFKSVPKDQFLLSFPSTSSKIHQRYKHRPRFFKKLHGKFATDDGA